MKCSKCLLSDTRVIESRDVAEGKAIRRRRECLDCQYRFTTYERMERPQIIVIKNSGERQLFNRDKLLGGLYRACEKTTMPASDVEMIAERIEDKVYAAGEAEISSSVIGQYVMDELAQTNEVAYVRFASVYRRFKDIDSFERELARIKNIKDNK